GGGGCSGAFRGGGPAPWPGAPPLERIIRRSLAKDPDQRFQTARDLKAALTWAMEQASAPAIVKPRRWWMAAALVVAALGGWAAAHFRPAPSDSRASRFEINPPDGGQFVFGNLFGGIAVSPDGQTVAYVASVHGTSGLWVHPLESAAARLIAGTEGAGHPFWSPDSKSVAFFMRRKLYRIELSGGAPS